MSSHNMILKETKDKVLYLILNRPDKLNSLIEPMREELSKAIDEIKGMKEINACVITGAGRGFCSGGDIKVMEEIIEKEEFDRVQDFLKWGREIVTGIRELTIPVIAAVNGPAAGAGMNLALACDLRLASSVATFGQTFVNIALHPDWGGSYYLPVLSNPSIALDLIWTGRIINAEEALRMGLINRIFSQKSFEQDVEAFANSLATKPKLVVETAKKNVYRAVIAGVESCLKFEEVAQAECIRTTDAREGMKAFLRTRASKRRDHEGLT